MLTKWIRSSTAAAVAALFANGEAGAVFIAQKPAEWGGVADLVTMYQDNLGTTPVTALEQTVGLHLDTRPILLGPELVTNGTFNAGSLANWTVTSNGVITGGIQAASSGVAGGIRITNDATGTDFGITQTPLATTSGSRYQVTLQRLGGTGLGHVHIGTGVTQATVNSVLANQTGSSFQFTAPGVTTYIGLGAGGPVANQFYEYDNISVREVISAPNTVGQPLYGASLIATGTIGLIGAATAATYNTGTGAGAATRVAAANQSYVRFAGTAQTFQRLRIQNTSATSLTVYSGTPAGTALATVANGVTTYLTLPLGAATALSIAPTADGTSITFTVLALQLSYGNHRSQSSAGARARLSARYNKVTARNANPVDLTNVTFTNAPNTLATCTVVNDATALAAAGLSGVCTLGNVYKIDNTLGNGAVTADLGGATGNTNTQAFSVWARGSGSAGNIGPSGNASISLTVTAAYARITGTTVPATTADLMRVRVVPGAVVFFILPDMRESCYSYLPTPQTIIGTGATAADYDDSGFPARLVYSGAQGSATGNIDFTVAAQAQTFWGGARLSEAAFGALVEFGANVNAIDQTFAAFSNTGQGFGCYTRGTVAAASYQLAAYAAPSAKVLSIQHDVTAATLATEVVPRVNGVLDQTGGGVTTTPSTAFTIQPANYGSRNNLGTGAGTLNLTGDEFISIIRGGATPTTDIIASVERFVGQKMLVYL